MQKIASQMLILAKWYLLLRNTNTNLKKDNECAPGAHKPFFDSTNLGINVF